MRCNRMLRILYVVLLLMVVGAHKHDPWKYNMKLFFEALTRDLNLALRKSLGMFPESSTDGSYEVSSTKSSTSGYSSTASTIAIPISPTTESTTKPCELDKESSDSSKQVYPTLIGSIIGVPGVHYPDYVDIPPTSFSCSDKGYIPGFYADMETGCQVFHVCWPHRMETFLCPIGTTFNQALQACDYWYSSNCSLSPHYYNINAEPTLSDKFGSKKDVNVGSMINVLLGTGHNRQSKVLQKADSSEPDSIMTFISQFLPVKATVTVYPESTDGKSKIVASASVGGNKKRVQHGRKVLHKTSVSTEKPTYTSEATTSEPQQSTPEIPNFMNTNLEESVMRILDRVSEIVESFLRDARALQDADKNPDHAKKYVPLTKLNPRFITKPVVLPTDESGKQSSTKTKRAIDIPKKLVLSEDYQHHERSVSPMTKEILSRNYLRLVKIRKS